MSERSPIATILYSTTSRRQKQGKGKEDGYDSCDTVGVRGERLEGVP